MNYLSKFLNLNLLHSNLFKLSIHFLNAEKPSWNTSIRSRFRFVSDQFTEQKHRMNTFGNQKEMFWRNTFAVWAISDMLRVCMLVLGA